MFTGTLNPVSNKATWTVHYEMTDGETDDLIDLSGVDEITVSIRDAATKSQILSATKTGGGVSVVDTGVFKWVFSASQMRTLAPKIYEVGCTFTDSDETIQLVIGTLPVIDGIVT